MQVLLALAQACIGSSWKLSSFELVSGLVRSVMVAFFIGVMGGILSRLTKLLSQRASKQT